MTNDGSVQMTSGSIPEPAVRDALDRVLATASFARAKRVASFLQFVVEESMAGRGDRLKAFTIASEVYGRDETFDPRKDTIVRVEAGRLRQRLGEYYSGEGYDDPVMIEIPKGGYAPRFSWNTNTRSTPATAVDAQPASERRLAVPLLATLLAAIVVALVVYIFNGGEQVLPQDTAVDSGAVPPLQNSLFLVVLPLTTVAGDPLEDRLAAGLVEAIVTDLAKLSGLSVMAHASLLKLEQQSGGLEDLSHYGATHALRGSLERDGERLRVNVQLVDINLRKTIWAERLDGDANSLLALQDSLADRIVNLLAVQVSREENKRLGLRHSNNPEALALYRQALVLMMPPNHRQRVVTARHMFQRIIELDPGFGGGYAGVSFTHSVSALFLKASDPQGELQKGIELSLQAIETDPDFGMGYVTLAFAYAMSGRREEALVNARRAVEVQPGDAFTQFVYGMCLTLSGQPDEAIRPLSEAIRLDPAEPRTPYRNVLGITYFAAQQLPRAAELFEENLVLGGPGGPHMDVFRAAVFAQLGQESQAREIIDDMLVAYPEFQYREWLQKWHRSRHDLLETLQVLSRLGLPIT